ncbi:MAG: MauE/DoxX family redox-associated membrane protein [Pseudomonadota bacterium]
MSTSEIYVRKEGRGSSLGEYWPLFSLTGISALAGLAIAMGGSGPGLDGVRSITMTSFMHGFMGVFLVVFALLKIFNLKGFRRGFTMYDLLAKRVRNYALVYPFIELVLGLAYLAYFMPVATYWATIVVFAFGTFGVILALRDGLDIDCPCMGSILSVPLSTVTLTEDLSMVVMAGLLLWGASV